MEFYLKFSEKRNRKRNLTDECRLCSVVRSFDHDCVCFRHSLTPNPSRPSMDRYSPLLQRLQRQQPTDRHGNIGLTVDPINEGYSRGKLRIYHVCASEIRIRAEFRNSVLRTHVQSCLPTLGSFFFCFGSTDSNDSRRRSAVRIM